MDYGKYPIPCPTLIAADRHGATVEAVIDRTRAYALLAAELERWRLQPRQQVAARIGAPAVCVLEMVGNESVCIEIKVRWADDRRTHLRVEAVAYGPSNWKLERLEEAITLELADVTR